MSQQVRAAALLRRAAELLDVPTSTSTSCCNPSSSTTTTTTAQISSGARALFGPYRNPRPFGYQRTSTSRRGGRVEPAVSTWSHKFSIVPRCDQETVPSREEKFKLHSAGLGDKRLAFVRNSNKMDFEKTLEEAFPKLKDCGGWELLRTPPGSRIVLENIRIPTGGYTSSYLADESNLGQAVCYIRPIQKDLDMGALSTEPSEPCQECLRCGDLIPINFLREHVQGCQLEETTEPPEKIGRMSVQTPVCQFTCISASNRQPNGPVDQSNAEDKQCPLCLEYFGEGVLELHASSCRETETCSSFEEWLQKNTPKWDKNWNISVIRRHIVQQAMEQAQEAEHADWMRNFTVEFVGEEGLDTGGLRREFFSLLFKSSPVFEKGVFSHDSSLLENKNYLYMGKFVAMAILTGHPGPRCLNDYIADFIITGKEPDVHSAPAAEITRQDVKHAVLEISCFDENTDLMEKYGELLQECGFTKMLTKSTKDSAIAAIKVHYLFNRYLPAILQFKEGLMLHNVLQGLQKFAESRHYLVLGEHVDMGEVKEFFKPVFSTEQRLKEKEEMVVYNFHQFLKKIERQQVLTPWIDLDNNTNVNTVLDMGHVLQALIGCPSLPKDLSNGLLTFDHASKGLTTVNTCGPSINFTRITELGNFDNFQTMMKNIIVGAYGFGLQ